MTRSITLIKTRSENKTIDEVHKQKRAIAILIRIHHINCDYNWNEARKEEKNENYYFAYPRLVGRSL